jgi:hypothetical protein
MLASPLKSEQEEKSSHPSLNNCHNQPIDVRKKRWGVQLSSTVIDKQVDTILGIFNQSLDSLTFNLRFDIFNAHTQEAGGQSRDMGSSHGCTRDGVGGCSGSNPGGSDVVSWRENIDNFAVVGKVRTDIILCGRTNGDGFRNGGWGSVLGIDIIVTGGDNEDDWSVVDGIVDGLVKSFGVATTYRGISDQTDDTPVEDLRLTERHVYNSLLTRLPDFVGNPVDARNNIGVASESVVTKNLDSNDVGLFCDTISLSSNGTSDMSSVTLTIHILGSRGERLSPRGSSFKLFMFNIDASVNNIDCLSLACRFVVEIRAGELVRWAYLARAEGFKELS